jgi:ribonuclease P protein component
MSNLRFPKKEKLAHRKLWDAVFSEGSRLKEFPLRLYYLRIPLPEKVPFQVGFAVPAKRFRRAVDRNRIRRLIREAYRLEKPVLFNNTMGGYAFVILYLGKDIPDFQGVREAMKMLIQKFIDHEKNAED